MESIETLSQTLARIDGRGYKAYKDIAGRYRADFYELFVDHVQGDPFAEPSRVRVRVSAAAAGLPAWVLQTPARRVAAADFFNRAFANRVHTASSRRGSGQSGAIRVLRPGQQVLARTSAVVDADGSIEARFRVGLPAHGRRIAGRQAMALFDDALPRLFWDSLRFEAISKQALQRHLETVEDAQALRAHLHAQGLVAFVADGAILPRRSGVDERPLDDPQVVPFASPETLRVTLHTPNAGAISGMGVPEGINLIVGGGYHGKSTLLRAIERGVYDHVPGDGRECVVARHSAVKIRAEDGRSVAGTDIANFIANLPAGQDTSHFSTANASGSTSQAAAIAEALELGADVLLLDEDTSATNFMIRDARMQALIDKTDEPITPFIDRVRQLAEQGVSTIVVVGGAGDYFDVADTVVAMRQYRPESASERAREIATAHPSHRRAEVGPWRALQGRCPQPGSIDARKGKKDVKIKTWAEDRVMFGAQEVDLGAVEQIVELAQSRAIADALVWAARGPSPLIDGNATVAEGLARLMAHIQRDGLEVLQKTPAGDFAMFRIFELGAFLNRLRSLRVRPQQRR